MSLAMRIARNPVLLALVAIGLFVALAGTFSVVPETKQAIILRLGDPVRVINRYHEDQGFGSSGAGLIARIPLIDRIVWIDKRMLDFNIDRQEVETNDRLHLLIDAFARYRVEDPLLLYRKARGERQLADLLRPSLANALRNEIARHSAAGLFGDERDAAMAAAQAALGRVARQFGVAITDVRIERVDLPEGAPLEAVYDRMRATRNQQAQAIRMDGYKQIQTITADADAAVAKIYADSYGQDPDFYAYYRALQSYRQSFGGEGSSPGGSTTMVLGPDSAYLRAFEKREK